MRVRKVKSDAVKLSETTTVKLKTSGNTQVVQFTAGNNKKCPVKNLSKDTYLDKKTGEVKQKKKLECGGKVTPPYANICVGMEESKCQATTQNIQRK